MFKVTFLFTFLKKNLYLKFKKPDIKLNFKINPKMPSSRLKPISKGGVGKYESFIFYML